jgi:hypothetical protein
MTEPEGKRKAIAKVRRLLVAIIAVNFSVSSASGDEFFGPGDIDGDTIVGLSDHDVFVDCLTGARFTRPSGECDAIEFARSDMDGDGDVDLRDFTVFSNRFGRNHFDYGPSRADKEAESLAIEIDDTIRASDTTYERIRRDLALCRDEFPELAEIRYRGKYAPRTMFVKLEEGMPTDSFDSLNELLIVVETREFSTIDWLLLTFYDTLNIPKVVDWYNNLPEVQDAGRNGVCCDGDSISVTPLWDAYAYEFVHGYGDCQSGCMCHELWGVVVTKDGIATLVSHVCPESESCSNPCP